MRMIVDSETVAEVINRYIKINEGDDPTVNLLMALGSDLLDCSEDHFLELLDMVKEDTDD